MQAIRRRLAVALVAVVATPVVTVGQSVEISIDATLARTLIDTACSGTDVSSAEIRRNPLIRAQLTHHGRLGDEYTLENYLSGLEAASRCEEPSPDPFRFGELVRRKDEIEANIEFLIENSADIAATVERLVVPYVPEDFSFRGGVVLSVAGSSCGGFAVDQAFFVDIPCLGPEVRSDYVALKYIIGHETYHAVQDLFVPPIDVEPHEVTNLPDAYSFLFHELVREGMAEYVADFGDVEEGGLYTAIFTGFERRNRSRMRWNFMLLDYLIELLGYREEEVGSRLADVYDIGFRGDLDQLFYHVGAKIAEVIETDFGRAALVCVTSLAPEQFILAYAGALEDGTSVSRAHAPGRSVLSAATDLAGPETSAWRRCLSAQRESPIDHELAADVFAEARGLSAASPWPGSLLGPLLFVDPATRYAVASQPDSAGVLVSTDTEGVLAGTLPADVVIANTATTWSGVRWTMLLWPPPAGYYGRRVLLGHEMFHRLGPEIGLPMANPVNGHLERGQGRLWLRLELRALARALAGSGSERRAALTDAMAFRARRHALFPEAAEEERALELNEGLAEYTGLRVSLPAGARAGWAVQRIESRETQADESGLSRSFAYATGPAYGLLLDAVEPGWTRRVDERSDLAELAYGAHGIEPDLARADISGSAAAYDGVRLERFEREREEAHERRQAMDRARYVEGPVLILPVDDELSYGFDPDAVSTLDGVGQVLATAEVRAGWGRLDVSGGVLLRRSDRGITAVVVPAPADLDTRPLTGDGWTLTLDEGWEVAPGTREGDSLVRRAR